MPEKDDATLATMLNQLTKVTARLLKEKRLRKYWQAQVTALLATQDFHHYPQEHSLDYNYPSVVGLKAYPAADHPKTNDELGSVRNEEGGLGSAAVMPKNSARPQPALTSSRKMVATGKKRDEKKARRNKELTVEEELRRFTAATSVTAASQSNEEQHFYDEKFIEIVDDESCTYPIIEIQKTKGGQLKLTSFTN